MPDIVVKTKLQSIKEARQYGMLSRKEKVNKQDREIT